MDTVSKVIIIICSIFSILNYLVFSRFKSRKAKDIRYILQMLLLLLIGYYSARGQFTDYPTVSWLPYLILPVVFISFGCMAIISIHNLFKLYKVFKPEYIFVFIKHLLSIIVLFAICYIYVFKFYNTSFTGIRSDSPLNIFVDFLYFSFRTFTTIGFPDMAVSSLAKALVMIEVSVFYISIGAGVKLLVKPKKTQNSEKEESEQVQEKDNQTSQSELNKESCKFPKKKEKMKVK